MATKTKKDTKAPNPAQERNTLKIEGKLENREQLLANVSAEGVATNAALLRCFSANLTGEIGITQAVHALRDTIDEVNSGDLSSAEAMLTAQAAALNAVFGELARRAALNMGEYMNATELYMRLALKAQGQCRATLETLAAIKSPPVVFARQANINNGGQQQVNNGAAPAVQYPARAAIAPPAPTGLLEQQHGEWLDTRAAGTAGGADPHMETVGAIDRAANR